MNSELKEIKKLIEQERDERRAQYENLRSSISDIMIILNKFDAVKLSCGPEERAALQNLAEMDAMNRKMVGDEEFRSAYVSIMIFI